MKKEEIVEYIEELEESKEKWMLLALSNVSKLNARELWLVIVTIIALFAIGYIVLYKLFFWQIEGIDMIRVIRNCTQNVTEIHMGV